MVPTPDKCEETSWHSAQKHAFLESYLKIWTDNVGKKDKPPSLDIVDLFAGYGWCHNKETGKTWEGTAILSAKCLKHYLSQHRCGLFLNSYNPEGGDAQERQLTALKEACTEVSLGRNRECRFETEPIEVAVDKALGWIRPSYPNFWILDPYSTDDLPWVLMERILKSEGTYITQQGTIIRRPELFINLMTSGLQRNIDVNPDGVTRCLGIDESIWRPKIDQFIEEGLNTREAITRIYSEHLESFYGKPPIALEVPSTHGNIVYVIIFCTQHRAAYYMMKRFGIEEYFKWRELEWKRPAREEATIKRVTKKASDAGQKQMRLDD